MGIQEYGIWEYRGMGTRKYMYVNIARRKNALSFPFTELVILLCLYIQTGQPQGEVAGHGGAVSGMSLSGKLLITACFDHFIRCYDTEVYSQYIIMCIHIYYYVQCMYIFITYVILFRL